MPGGVFLTDSNSVEKGTTGNPLVVSGTTTPSGTANVNLTQIGSTTVVTGGVAGSQGVGGTSASGATDDGSNPVKVGGIYLTTPTLLTNGQRGNFQLSPQGAMPIGALNGVSFSSLATAPNLATNGSGTLSSGITAVFNTALPAYTNGQFGMVQMTSDGGLRVANAPSSVAGAACSTSSTAVAASSLVVKGTPGNLYGINGASGASAGYVMLFDATAAPGDGTVTPKKVWNIAANASLEVTFDPPIRCATGITLVFSTTGPFTKTASATAFLSGDYA